MTNSREHPQDNLRSKSPVETNITAPEVNRAAADIEHRHYAPIETALPNKTSDYEWKLETGDIQSYQHNHTGGWLHIDPQGQFYDRYAQPIVRDVALDHAGHGIPKENAQVNETGHYRENDMGISL